MKRLPKKVRPYFEKARDSALLAVEIYNKPAVRFKSNGYITLMIIAWTSLFHSIFLKKNIKPFYKGINGRYLKRDGDYKHWELDECLRQYYKTDTQNPERKNMEFFIPLRNKIEHRYLPELDSDIFGECQALLFNFDEMLEEEFDKSLCIRECLSFSLQLYPSSESLIKAVKSNPDSKSIAEFIENYRSAITPDIMKSGKYAFKAFLIQVANHKSAGVLPIQFVNYDKLTNSEQTELYRFVAMIKFKEVTVMNADRFKASEVVKQVQEALGNPKIIKSNKTTDKFNLHTHTLYWKEYSVRPAGKSKDPENTKHKYCIYDKPHKDYLYTKDWIDLLIDKMRDERV